LSERSSQRVPAVRIHGECTRCGNAAHSDGENAGHIAPGALEQDRGVGGRSPNEQALKVRLRELLGSG